MIKIKTQKIYLCNNNFSNTLSHMMKTGIGYRYNNYNNDSILSLKKVINFEVKELHNKDIFYTMKRIYNDYHIPFYYTTNLKIKYTLKYLANKLDCKIDDLKCIWLTTKEYAERYNKSSDDELRSISINSLQMIPISDLGSDGALFVTGLDFIPF